MKTIKNICLAFLFSLVVAYAHPVPDIPVRSNLVGDVIKVQIEVDLRFFKEKPIEDPYTFKRELDQWSFLKKDEILKKAQSYVATRLQFELGGKPTWFPPLKGSYKKLGGTTLMDSEDPVVVVLEGEFKLRPDQKTYVVKSTAMNEWGVEVAHSKNGKKIPREVSLFPGEKSFVWSVIP